MSITLNKTYKLFKFMFKHVANKKPKRLYYKHLGFIVVAQPGVEPGLF